MVFEDLEIRCQTFGVIFRVKCSDINFLSQSTVSTFRHRDTIHPSLRNFLSARKFSAKRRSYPRQSLSKYYDLAGDTWHRIPTIYGTDHAQSPSKGSQMVGRGRYERMQNNHRFTSPLVRHLARRITEQYGQCSACHDTGQSRKITSRQRGKRGRRRSERWSEGATETNRVVR